MAAQITTLLAQPMQLAAEGRIKATAGASTRRATIASGTWLRHYLASSGAGGASHDDPKEALAALQSALNSGGQSGWLTRMRSDCVVEVTNTGSTFALTMDASDADSNLILRDLYGFSGNVASTAAGTWVAANYSPAGTLCSIARIDSAGWQCEAPLMASATMPTGVTIAFVGALTAWSRTFDLAFHPYTNAYRDANRPHTPFAPASWTRWQQASAPALGSMTGPYSAVEFLMSCPGLQLGAALSPTSFDAHIRGETTTYDVCYLDPASLQRNMTALSSPNNAAMRTLRALRFTKSDEATRS